MQLPGVHLVRVRQVQLGHHAAVVGHLDLAQGHHGQEVLQDQSLVVVVRVLHHPQVHIKY